MNHAIGYTFPRGGGVKAIFEQFVLDDEGCRVYGVYQIPEAECLRSVTVMPAIPSSASACSSTASSATCSATRMASTSSGRTAERGRGVWVLTPEVMDDTPMIVAEGGQGRRPVE